MLTEPQIRAMLAAVNDPLSEGDLIAAGRLDGLAVEPERAVVSLGIPAAAPPEVVRQFAAVRDRLAAQLQQAAGLDQQIRVILTGSASAVAAPRPNPATEKIALPHVRRVIAVASGKGGVGKSTTAVNLAVALALQGQAVGLCDLDIYGPSVPMLLGLTEKPESIANGATVRMQPAMLPYGPYGLQAMSIGLLVDPNAALIWRGPMVQSAVTQLLRDVDWGSAEAPLDTLILDLPPGTGDAQLTLVQKLQLDGAVIVTTPQDLALIDARRAIAMFRKVSVPILGLIENMSSFACEACGHDNHPFGHGGGAAEAVREGIAFLGTLPLDLATRAQSDLGLPIAAAQPEGAAAKAYMTIAKRVVHMQSN